MSRYIILFFIILFSSYAYTDDTNKITCVYKNDKESFTSEMIFNTNTNDFTIKSNSVNYYAGYNFYKILFVSEDKNIIVAYSKNDELNGNNQPVYIISINYSEKLIDENQFGFINEPFEIDENGEKWFPVFDNKYSRHCK